MAKERERVRRWQSLDFYAALGIPPGCSVTEVRQGFRRIARTCHPDKVPPEEREQATRQFQLIAEAYEVLGSDATRREYDEARRKAGFPTAPQKAAAKPKGNASAGTPQKAAAKPKGNASAGSAGYSRKPPGSQAPTGERWSWPSWCLDGKSPCIEVLVIDSSFNISEWVKAKPHARITDPKTGQDTHLNANYRWRGEEYSEDFEPDRVRRRGEVITVAEVIRSAAGTGSPRHETHKGPSQPDKQPDSGKCEPSTVPSKPGPGVEQSEPSADNQDDETVDKLDILMAMGFEETQAKTALERCTSLEAAVEYIMAQGCVTANFGEYIAPAAQAFYNSVIQPAAKYLHGDPKAAQLAYELEKLGFDEAQARAAAERCSSVEAAVEWIEGS